MQYRQRRHGQIGNLVTNNRSELIFLKTELLESLNLEGSLEEAIRRLYLMKAPEDVKPEIHSSLGDLLSGYDCLKRMQKTISLMFRPGIKFSTATNYANQRDAEHSKMDVNETRLLEELIKEQKAREEEDGRNKQTYGAYKRGKTADGAISSNYKGRKQLSDLTCFFCQTKGHIVSKCKKKIEHDSKSKST